MHAPTPDRRHDLDWVRILAFALLIGYHVGMYYVSWDWHVKSPFASDALEPVMMLSSPWRLSLLFVVSGAAMAFTLARRPGGFMAARSRRLLLPLVFGMAVIVAPQAWLEVVEKQGYTGSFGAFWVRYLSFDPGFCGPDGRCLRVPTWNHLWFVAYLWVYSLLAWGLAKAAPGPLGRLEDALARSCSGPGVLLLPIALFALARVALVGRYPSTHALWGDLYNHAQYGCAFGLGFLLARHAGPWEAMLRLRWASLALAAAGQAFILWYFFLRPQDVGVSDALRTFQRFVFAVLQWTVIASVLGFARRWSPGDGPARRYLTEAVFPFYVVHQTAIVVAAHALKPWRLAPAAEGPLLVALTVAACFASFEIVRRIRWLRPWFGLAAAPHQAALPTRSLDSSSTPSSR